MIPQAWKENKPKIMRRIVFFFLIVIVAAIQNADILPSIFGMKLLPLLPFTVVLSMFERETYGLVFGCLAGILWDINSAGADGYSALLFALIGFTCGLLMTYVMMNNLLTASILTFFWCNVYAVLTWLVRVGFHDVAGKGSLLLSFYLPSAWLNVLLMPLAYYAVRSIMKLFKDMENDELMY